MWTVATERLYQTPTESVTAKSLEWGKELEPFAIQAYEVETGNVIIQTGFVMHKTIEYCGGSPDGLIGDIGGVEVKCPKDRRIHMQTWRYGMPEDHIPQVQGNIWINGLEWLDFISYDPRAPDKFRLYVQRIHRDEKYILALASHVVDFLADVKSLVEQINENQSRCLLGTTAKHGGKNHADL